MENDVDVWIFQKIVDRFDRLKPCVVRRSEDGRSNGPAHIYFQTRIGTIWLGN